MVNKTEKRTEYNELIGRIDDEYYFLKDVFTHSKDFKGATGSVLRPVTKSEAEDRRERWDDDNELWKIAVQSGNTDLGADDWHAMVINADGDDVVFDLSDRDLADKLMAKLDDDDIEIIECRDGGRCFDINMKWDEIYRPDLWKIIKQYES